MFKVKTLNTISPVGLDLFPRDLFEISSDSANPDAILVRSQSMHETNIPDSVKIIGRAGAGVNNIPVAALTARGIPVFNTPGANANAVRELVLASMLLASRNICQAWDYVKQLKIDEQNLNKEIEQNKKQFVGMELLGKTLGIIGLGSVGVKVANAALGLGMRVIGFDPLITVNRAWELSSNVKQAYSIDDLLMASDFVTFHVPLNDTTQSMMNNSRFNALKKGAVLLNFSREAIIDNAALRQALDNKKISRYVTDFPLQDLRNHPLVISLPHLGASTKEAEENCAVMIVEAVREFLENGAITNSVNFPQVELPKLVTGCRLLIVNANVPNMVAQISAHLANAKLNIISLVNKSLNEIAYTVIDLNYDIDNQIIRQIKNIPGVKQVRVVKPISVGSAQ